MIDCNRKIEHYRETPHPRELWSGRGGIILWSKWEKIRIIIVRDQKPIKCLARFFPSPRRKNSFFFPPFCFMGMWENSF